MTWMARLEDIPEPTRTAVANLPCPSFDTTPFVGGPPLSERGDKPFPFGSGEYRAVPSDWDNSDILMSHVSINFDRAGFQRDINVLYPIDRLREFAADGVIGSVAAEHFTVIGSTDPAAMLESADAIAAALIADKCNAVVLAPV
jgi:D-proline reductase (dithiol) PrdB